MAATHLVISYGGLTGIKFLGVLHKLYETGKLNNITTYHGTSVGALICAFMTIGMTPFQIFSEFCQFNKQLKPQLAKFVFDKDTTSLYSFSAIEQHLITVFKKYSPRIPTFKDLAVSGKNLHIYAHSVDKDEIVEFSAAKTPNTLILDAAIASSTIPFIFPFRSINNELLIDGAISCPIPCTSLKRDDNAIIVHSIPRQIKYYLKLSNKFGILLSLIYQSMFRESQRILSTMKDYTNIEWISVEPVSFVVTTTLTIEEKWAMFFEGTTAVLPF